MKKSFLGVLIFTSFWVLLSERIDLQVIIIGGLLSLIIYFLNSEGFKVKFKSIRNFKKIYYLIIYLLILIKEIIIANFYVAKVVLSKTPDISPTVIEFDSKLKSNLNKTILANSITLTPGTMTISVDGSSFRVHCLQEKFKIGIVNSKFEEILLKIEEQ